VSTETYPIRLATMITASERSYEELAADCWQAHDCLGSIRYRAMAEGLAMARTHQLVLAQEMRGETAVTRALGAEAAAVQPETGTL